MPQSHTVAFLLAALYAAWAAGSRWVVSRPQKFLFQLGYFDRTFEPRRRTLRRTRMVALVGHAILVFLAVGTLAGVYLPPTWLAGPMGLAIEVAATVAVLCVTLQGTLKLFRKEDHRR